MVLHVHVQRRHSFRHRGLHERGRQHRQVVAVGLHVHVPRARVGPSAGGVRGPGVGVEAEGIGAVGDAPRHVRAGGAQAQGVGVAGLAGQVAPQLEVPLVALPDLHGRLRVLHGPHVADAGADAVEGAADRELRRGVVGLKGREVDVAVCGDRGVVHDGHRGVEGVGQQLVPGGALALVQTEHVPAVVQGVDDVLDADDVPHGAVEEQRRREVERVVDVDRGAQDPAGVRGAVAVDAHHRLVRGHLRDERQRAVGGQAHDLLERGRHGLGVVALRPVPDRHLLEGREVAEAARDGDDDGAPDGGLLQVRVVRLHVHVP
mmetsp:Transcript_6205/g.11545  ORF Transcript_6205/g.11545 Transcript_6205/m.11545 type:complete len:318 (-) Transcript_6205:2427-3380(-)